jgi:hypothetical protein
MIKANFGCALRPHNSVHWTIAEKLHPLLRFFASRVINLSMKISLIMAAWWWVR